MSSSLDPHGSTEESSSSREGGAAAAAAGDLIDATQINDADVLLGRGGKSHPGNSAFRQVVAEHARAYSQAKRAQKTALSRQLIGEVASRGGRFLVAVKDSKVPRGNRGGEQPSASVDPAQPQWKVATCWKVASDKEAMEKAKQSLRDTAAKDASAKSGDSSSSATPVKQGKKTAQGTTTKGQIGAQKQQKQNRNQPHHSPPRNREIVQTSVVYDEAPGFVTTTATTTTTTITTKTTHTTMTVPEAPSFQPAVRDFGEIVTLLSDEEDGNVEQSLEKCLGGGDISVNLSAAAEELLQLSPTPLPFSSTADPPPIPAVAAATAGSVSLEGLRAAAPHALVRATLPFPTTNTAVSPVDSLTPTCSGPGATTSSISPVGNIAMPTLLPQQQAGHLVLPNAGQGRRRTVQPAKSRTIATGRIANDDEDLQKILGWFREDSEAEDAAASSRTDASESCAGGSSGYYSESSSASISSPSVSQPPQMANACGYTTSPGSDSSPSGGQVRNNTTSISFPPLQPIAEGVAMPLPPGGSAANSASAGIVPVGVAPFTVGAPGFSLPLDAVIPQDFSNMAPNNASTQMTGNGMPASFVPDHQQQQPIVNTDFVQQPLFQQQLHQHRQPVETHQALPAFGEQPSFQGLQQQQRANPNTTGVQQGAPKRARYEDPAPITDRLAPLYDWGTELDEVTQNYLEYSLPVTLPALSWLLGYSRVGIWFCILTVVFHILESALTNFGPRTRSLRFPFAPIAPVTHMFIDCGLIWGHSLVYALFPRHFGPHPYILSFCIWCTLPYYVASSYKTYVYKVRREKIMGSKHNNGEKEVGGEEITRSAGVEVLSSDESSSTNSSYSSSDDHVPYLIEEKEALNASSRSRNKSSASDYAHVRYGRKVVLVKWKEE
mmetsp:Transcript_3242/g.9313  ORF Transcript_3242/g.9313 Transcript_3242/m.9313 type:complete len:891 (-) Transcript_3242:315-2987(-)|eukprot:CAMPEP_0181037362 /NCGR_PEP_ID=MMETSP1070-20121207/9359_1 /TAXON_ID=265543 /ORGANISM="Minutocellus polymorphus, Strain NH13" /LENGTH=890 /DNA_ID=CAMNT_0023115069 /DNA_START=69 /DNA_END=2741 /DNA_ORIENTATION=-